MPATCSMSGQWSTCKRSRLFLFLAYCTCWLLTAADEKGIYHMMDGKQRVASLLAFMNANPYIGAEDPTSKEALWKK